MGAAVRPESAWGGDYTGNAERYAEITRRVDTDPFTFSISACCIPEFVAPRR
jgi:hypothetical protein